MKRKKVLEIQGKEKVALDIYDYKGNQLLKKGAEIKVINIEKLKLYDIPFIYVADNDLKISTIFDTKTISDLLKVLWCFINSSGENSEILKRYNVDEVKMFSAYSNEEGSKIAYGHIFKYFISEMIKTLKKKDNIYYDFTDYRNLETYCNFHMISVTCISLMIGYSMKLDEKDLLDLGVGALLYDLKMDMYKFVNQGGKLNEIEKEEMQQHTFMSFDTMRKIYGISSKSASIAFQHHERIDGSGYPKRLKGDDIGLLSKIVAVADVYDAYISKRPFREAYNSDEAWNYIVDNKDILFEKKVTNIFEKVVAKYLPGSIVELNTGDKAMILYNDVEDMENPMIKVIEKKGKSDIIFDTKSFYLKDKHRSVIRILESIG